MSKFSNSVELWLISVDIIEFEYSDLIEQSPKSPYISLSSVVLLSSCISEFLLGGLAGHL